MYKTIKGFLKCFPKLGVEYMPVILALGRPGQKNYRELKASLKHSKDLSHKTKLNKPIKCSPILVLYLLWKI